MKIKKTYLLKPIPKMICLCLAVFFCSLTEFSNDLRWILVYTACSLGFAVLPCLTFIKMEANSQEELRAAEVSTE